MFARRRFRKTGMVAITLAPWLAFGTLSHAEAIGVASVIDGDMIEIHGQRTRLHGIAAPESRQTCLDDAGQS
jgi:endonuclease YncB( thermonuclease family)